MAKVRTPSARWRAPVARRLLRRPVVWWALVGLSILAVFGSIRNEQQAAAVERARWGPPVAVAVATEDHTVGDVIGSGFVVEWLPPASVPPEAINAVGADAVALVAIHKGEMLTARRVGVAGSPQVEGHDVVVLVVPDTGFDDRLSVGSRARVFDNATPSVLASSVVIVARSEGGASIAVRLDEGPAVASALAGRGVTLGAIGG